MDAKKVIDSKTEQVHTVRPTDLNAGGRLFGGTLLQWIDEVAGIVAKRHANSPNVTTAAIDNLIFKSGVRSGDLIILIGYVTYVGHTSMEVRIDTYLEDYTGMRKPVNRAYFVMVAMDEYDKPTKVPGLIIDSESERAEWEGAKQRKSYRIERRKQGF